MILSGLSGALVAFFVAFGVHLVAKRRASERERARARVEMSADQEAASRIRALEQAVSDVASELTRRLETQDTSIRSLRDEWESAYAKMRSVEARVDRKRQALAQDEDAEEEEAPPWEKNGAAPAPAAPAMTLEQRVWALRHGGRR